MSLTLQVWINTTWEGDSIAKNNNQWNISSISSLYTKDMNRVAFEIGIFLELHSISKHFVRMFLGCYWIAVYKSQKLSLILDI